MGILCLLTQVYRLVLFAYIILQFVPRPPEPIQPLVDGIRMLVDPLLRPLRNVIPSVPIGAVRLDLSILVLFIGTGIIGAVVCR